MKISGVMFESNHHVDAGFERLKIVACGKGVSLPLEVIGIKELANMFIRFLSNFNSSEQAPWHL